jgi:hypothetical protein
VEETQALPGFSGSALLSIIIPVSILSLSEKLISKGIIFFRRFDIKTQEHFSLQSFFSSKIINKVGFQYAAALGTKNIPQTF